jgi:hypothetical protein
MRFRQQLEEKVDPMGAGQQSLVDLFQLGRWRLKLAHALFVVTLHGCEGALEGQAELLFLQ